jgi:NAD(P)-dependent dehydrogenase (short-subunit alcohol dehydrogenase family)
MEIKNKLAIITGGGSGLGADTARMLANEGAIVALLDASEDNIHGLAREIGGLSYYCDVTSEQSMKDALAWVIEEHDGTVPQILINCAGIAPGAKIVSKGKATSLELFRQVVEVNLVGTYNVMRLVAAEMMKVESSEEERGIIINTSSIAAFEGQVGQAAYAASKGGVSSLTMPAAREFAKHAIRVNAIAPGFFGTPMVEGMSDKVKEGLLGMSLYPKRFGLPKEFAHLIQAIIENPMLNGETIRLDGGVRMQGQ